MREDFQKPTSIKSEILKATKLNMSEGSAKMLVDSVNFEGSLHDNPDETLAQRRNFPFTARTLAASLDQKCSFQAIKGYVQNYHASTVHDGLLEKINNRLIITHVIQRNDAKMLRIFLEYDESACSSVDFGVVPVLAFAIMRSKWSNDNTTDIVKTLLAFGADPNVIPQELWEDYINTPVPGTLTIESDTPRLTAWCTVKKTKILEQTLNLTMRYTLWKAARMEPPQQTKTTKSQKQTVSNPFFESPM